jgi:hypothetical protein
LLQAVVVVVVEQTYIQTEMLLDPIELALAAEQAVCFNQVQR